MAIKGKTILCMLFFVATNLGVFAQSGDSTAKSIAKIKRDAQYLYAEATMKVASEAVDGAKAILETMVGEWVRKMYPDEDIEVCIVKAKEHCQQLQTQRGDYYRAFVYVKKSDIMAVSDKNEVNVFKVQPIGEGSTLVASDSAIYDLPSNYVTTTIVLTDEERRMLCIRRFSDIEPYVKGLKSTGVLCDYGKYATLPVGAACHLFVYNREGDIIALLRSDGNEQVNLRTLQQDDIKRYKNCGAFWLLLKTTSL